MKKFIQAIFVGKSAAWTGLSTVVMCIFSGLLWNVSTIANQNNIATQRAVLSANGPGVQKSLGPDHKTIVGYTVNYAMVNSGSMPASRGSAQVDVSIGQGVPGERDFAKLPQAQTVSFVLGPKGGMNLVPIGVSLEDMEAVAAKKKHMFMWGWVTYKDGFSHTPERLTEFCTDVSEVAWSQTDHAATATDIQLITPPCETHNCYDDDCTDYEARTR